MGDARYLYVCLISYDESIIQQIRHGGFSISFTHSELGKNNIGIRFIGSKRDMPPPPFSETSPRPPSSQKEASFESLELSGPQYERAKIVPAHNIDTTTVQYRLTGTRDKLILELRMALQSDIAGNVFSLGINTDTTMTICLETTVPEGHPGSGPPPRREDEKPGGGPSGRRGGPPEDMRGPPPGNGNGPHGEGREVPEPLKIKIYLRLANNADMTH